MTRNSNKRTTEYFLSGQPVIKKSLVEEKLADRRTNLFYLGFLGVLFLLMLTIVCVNTFLFAFVNVKGKSMEPTLYTGDLLVANRTKEVTRGSIVIIKDENPDDWLIKRVIGLPGETLLIEDGYVYILEGATKHKLDEPYVKELGVTKVENSFAQRLFKIPDGEYFYLGDNRGNSTDSRTYGTCSKEQIVGVVEQWSIDLTKWVRSIKNR